MAFMWLWGWQWGEEGRELRGEWCTPSASDVSDVRLSPTLFDHNLAHFLPKVPLYIGKTRLEIIT